MIDNAPCQKKITERIRLKTVQIFYLSPNTTVLTQPMDAGVTALMKRRFRPKQIHHAFQVVDANGSDKYKIDQYTASAWLRKT